jgi:hypothetical protein
MPRPLLLLTLSGAILLLSSAPNAQRLGDMVPGHVVTLAGDTIRGEIVILPDVDAARRVEFRPAGEDQILVLSSFELAAYATADGREYFARNLVPTYEGRLQLIFLRRLVEGPVTLYTYAYSVPAEAVSNRPDLLTDRDEIIRYAVETEDETVHPLYRLRWQESGGAMTVLSDNIYQRTLAEVFASCEPMVRRASRVRYTRSDLVSAVLRYNECVGSPSVSTVAASGRTRLGIGVSASLRGGLGAALVSNRGSGESADSRIAPYGGVTVEIIGQRLPGRTALVTELAFKQKGTSAEAHESLSPLAPRHYNKPLIGLSLGVSHALDVPWGPYANVGILTGHFIGQEAPYVSGFSLISPYAWESGFYAEVGARLATVGFGDIVLGLRGESALLSDGPIGRRQENARTGAALGHRSQSLFVVLGLRL